MSIKLCTVDEIETRLDQDQSDQSIVTQLIYYYSDVFLTQLNRELEKKERTEYFDYERHLYLKAFPIDTGATIDVSLQGILGNSYDALSNGDDYEVYADKGLIRLFFTPVRRPKRIKVVYTGGFATDNNDPELILVNDAIKGAIIHQVSHTYRRRKELGATTVNYGRSGTSVSVAEPAKLLPEVQMVLDKYKRIAI